MWRLVSWRTEFWHTMRAVLQLRPLPGVQPCPGGAQAGPCHQPWAIPAGWATKQGCHLLLIAPYTAFPSTSAEPSGVFCCRHPARAQQGIHPAPDSSTTWAVTSWVWHSLLFIFPVILCVRSVFESFYIDGKLRLDLLSGFLIKAHIGKVFACG